MNLDSEQTWYGCETVWTARAYDNDVAGDRAFGLTKAAAESAAIDNYLKAKNGEVG
jgi:hypothetical protein